MGLFGETACGLWFYFERGVSLHSERLPVVTDDLIEDPYEMHDLSSQQPARVSQMKAGLAQWILAVAKSRGPTETNCEAIGPPPPPAHPAGRFTPVDGGTNCTFTEDVTMPGTSSNCAMRTV